MIRFLYLFRSKKRKTKLNHNDHEKNCIEPWTYLPDVYRDF